MTRVVDERRTSLRRRRHELGKRVLDAVFGWAEPYAIDPRAPHAQPPLSRRARRAKRKRRLEQKRARAKNRRRT